MPYASVSTQARHALMCCTPMSVRIGLCLPMKTGAGARGLFDHSRLRRRRQDGRLPGHQRVVASSAAGATGQSAADQLAVMCLRSGGGQA